MKLFRILHWRARARYWQRKAEKFERTIKVLRAELNAEMWRNRDREDTFVSATVMGGRNMYGVQSRSGPAAPQPVRSTQPVMPNDPWHQLSWADKAEFQEVWWPGAEAVGRSQMQARQDFMEELAKRKQLNDEPFGAN